MKILAFDTTASTLSIALLDDEKVIVKNTIFESGKQSELLIPEIEKILRSQKIWYENLDLIAATNGPGSFTGSRIGLTAARTLKSATNLPLILINSCEAIAFKYRNINGRIFVLLDAAMDEFFAAEFFCKNEKIKQITEPHLVGLKEAQEILSQENSFLCGAPKKDILEADLVGLCAYEKFKNGETSQNLNPLYLRAPRISERKK